MSTTMSAGSTRSPRDERPSTQHPAAPARGAAEPDRAPTAPDPAEPDHVLAGALDQPLRLLAEDGTRRPDAQLDPYLRDVDQEKLVALLHDMTVIRALDDEAVALQRQGELGLWPPLRGQEAAQIGLARALPETDFFFTSYRENGIAWCRGVEPAEMLSVWRGTALSGWDPFARHMATPQVIIGAQTHHAVGHAMATSARGEDRISVACFGDGAMSQGDVNEAMVFAASFRAPVLFFCQNNHYAISEPVALQSTVPLSHRPAGFGIPSLRVDGNDVLAVHAATRLAAERIRSGAGPCSSRPSPTGSDRTPRATTPPATATRTSSPPGAGAIRSCAWSGTSSSSAPRSRSCAPRPHGAGRRRPTPSTPPSRRSRPPRRSRSSTTC